MNELINQVTSNGTYDNVPTSLTSNISVVNLVDGLTLKLEANKKTWLNETLTYTITLTNETDVPYLSPVITDVLDTNFIVFVDGSAKVNGANLSSDKYTYDKSSGFLTFNMDDIGANENIEITFEVTKKS